MAKATYYLGLFLGGCVATSLLGVVASIHPVFFKISAAIFCLLFLLWLLGWMLDDWLISLFNFDRMNYYGVLILALVAAVLGGLIALWTVM